MFYSGTRAKTWASIHFHGEDRLLSMAKGSLDVEKGALAARKGSPADEDRGGEEKKGLTIAHHSRAMHIGG